MTPSGLFSLSGIGVEAVEKILLATMGEWATAYLRAAEHGTNASAGRSRSEEMLQLIGRAPDPVDSEDSLSALRDSSDADTRWLIEQLHTDSHFRYMTLRGLLPGLGLAEPSAFSLRLSHRAANALEGANVGTLSALARLTPAAVLALPNVGIKVGEEILGAAVSEWASTHLGQGARE